MARRRVNTTKHEIIRYALGRFLEIGYSETSSKMICEELDLSSGNLTYYFPTKEHLLGVLVEMLCDFQGKLMEREADDGVSSIMAICLELTAMAAMCEEDAIAKDFYLSAYSSPLCLQIIRRNDGARARQVFATYCPEWTQEQFAEAAALVSGIEYATLMKTDDDVSLEMRIAGALDAILHIYGVPKEIRAMKTEKVLAMDYRAIGRRVLMEFKQYVEMTTEHTLDEMIHSRYSST